MQDYIHAVKQSFKQGIEAYFERYRRIQHRHLADIRQRHQYTAHQTDKLRSSQIIPVVPSRDFPALQHRRKLDVSEVDTQMLPNIPLPRTDPVVPAQPRITKTLRVRETDKHEITTITLGPGERLRKLLAETILSRAQQGRTPKKLIMSWFNFHYILPLILTPEESKAGGILTDNAAIPAIPFWWDMNLDNDIILCID